MSESLVKFNVPAVAGGGEIIAAQYKGQPVFPAVKMAEALGYADPHQALSKHAKSLIKLNSVESTEMGFAEISSNRGLMLIGEADLYRLIMSSKLPTAVAFQDWVVEDVLPAIRKTGSYAVEPAPMQVMPAINVQDLATAVATAVVFALKAVKDDAPAPAAPTAAPAADFGIDPRQEYSITELAAMLNTTPQSLRRRLVKDKAITSIGVRGWEPTEAMTRKDYCLFVPMVGWKFNRLGAVNIVKYYSAKLA